jgi:hypothetical protein
MSDPKYGKWIVTEPMPEEQRHEGKDGPSGSAMIHGATYQPAIGLPILCRRG